MTIVSTLARRVRMVRAHSLSVLGACGTAAVLVVASACGTASEPTPVGGVVAAVATAAATAVSGAAANVSATAAAAVATAAAPVLDSDQVGGFLRATGQALGGLNLSAVQTPPDVPPDEAASVALQATDMSGSFGELAPSTREALVSAALAAASRVYPNAAVTLTVLNADGSANVRGTSEPDQEPVVTVG